MRKMGSLGSIMKMIPGHGEMQVGEKEEKRLKHSEALIQSMTPKERRKPQHPLNGRRRGPHRPRAGLEIKELNAPPLSPIKQFAQMKNMMRMMKGAKGQKR